MKAFLARACLQAALVSIVAAFAMVNPAVAAADTVTQWNANVSSALFGSQDSRVATPSSGDDAWSGL
jgi:hypothetical protein